MRRARGGDPLALGRRSAWSQVPDSRQFCLLRPSSATPPRTPVDHSLRSRREESVLGLTDGPSRAPDSAFFRLQGAPNGHTRGMPRERGVVCIQKANNTLDESRTCSSKWRRYGFSLAPKLRLRRSRALLLRLLLLLLGHFLKCAVERVRVLVRAGRLCCLPL